jgi:hypothetical protein
MDAIAPGPGYYDTHVAKSMQLTTGMNPVIGTERRFYEKELMKNPGPGDYNPKEQGAHSISVSIP